MTLVLQKLKQMYLLANHKRLGDNALSGLQLVNRNQLIGDQIDNAFCSLLSLTTSISRRHTMHGKMHQIMGCLQ